MNLACDSLHHIEEVSSLPVVPVVGLLPLVLEELISSGVLPPLRLKRQLRYDLDVDSGTLTKGG